MHNSLAQAGDPLLLAEGVIGLQAVRVDFGAPSAAHTETVLHYGMKTESVDYSLKFFTGFITKKMTSIHTNRMRLQHEPL